MMRTGRYNVLIEFQWINLQVHLGHKVNVMLNKSTPYEYNQRLRTLSIVIWIVMAASFFLGLFNIQFRTWPSVITLFSLAVLCIPLLWLNRKGRTTLSSIFLSLIVLMVINVNIWDGDGIRDSAILAYPIFIMISILFLGKRTAPPVLSCCNWIAYSACIS